MKRVYVQDFLIEEYRNQSTTDFFCTVAIYYSFNKENESDSLEYFSISAGTPEGIFNYLKGRINNRSINNISLFPHLIIMDKYCKEDLLSYIKTEMESVYGISEEEVILKLLQNFDWEYLDNQEVMNNLFRKG